MKDRIFISLGSSIGDGASRFKSAEIWLKDKGIKIIKKSKNYTFAPYGGVAKNEFTNAVWEVAFDPTPGSELETELRTRSDRRQARLLLEILLKCEAAHDRTREIRWEDRTLDLDLLIYKNERFKTKSLTIPHPEMHKRDFVQIPLQEIL